jgi:uncharacterized membrane protein
MIWLISGLGLWTLAHLFRRLSPGARAALGERPGKAAAAALIAISVVMMVHGYKNADGAAFWGRTPAMTGINNLLMLLAFYVFGASAAKGPKAWIGTRIRHPQLAAVKIWAVAHLLVNGDVPSFVLFGGLLVWAGAEMAAINRAEGPWAPPARAPARKEIALAVTALALFGLVAALHAWLGYPPFG